MYQSTQKTVDHLTKNKIIRKSKNSWKDSLQTATVIFWKSFFFLSLSAKKAKCKRINQVQRKLDILMKKTQHWNICNDMLYENGNHIECNFNDGKY